MMSIPLSRSRSGLRVMGVGGGAFSTTYGGRWVTDAAGQLKPPVYQRSKGNLACACDQAGVMIEPGDYVWIAAGALPFKMASVTGYRVISISEEVSDYDSPRINGRVDWGVPTTLDEWGGEAIIEPTDAIYPGRVPDELLLALTTYHNRNGLAFVLAPSAAPNSIPRPKER